MVVATDNGRERVDGRLRPGNEVKRTLTVGEAIMDWVYAAILRCTSVRR